MHSNLYFYDYALVFQFTIPYIQNQILLLQNPLAAAAAAATKLSQLCPTLCDPRDGSPHEPLGKNIKTSRAPGYFFFFYYINEFVNYLHPVDLQRSGWINFIKEWDKEGKEETA